MRRDDSIHPPLASRRRIYLLVSLLVVVSAAGLVFGYFVLSGRLALMPAAVTHAQADGDAGKADIRASPVAGSAAAAASQAAAFEPRNSVSRQASAWGVKACLGQIAVISDFLTDSRTYTALSQRAERAADGEAFASTIAARDPQGIVTVSTFASIPVGKDECNSSYQTVASFAMPCDAAHREYFSNFDEPLAFGDHVRAYANAQKAHLFLLPVGDAGCTAVKTQTLIEGQ